MARLMYVTGGARSGKSGFAEKLAKGYEQVTYIATSLAGDDEMKARIAHHQAQRPAHWRTVEAPIDVVAAYQESDAAMSGHAACLFDCVTMWVTNQMFSDLTIDWDTIPNADIDIQEAKIRENTAQLIKVVQSGTADMIVVTNELGMGVVPAYRLGRIFRDIAGRVNQQIAQVADRAVLMVSGLPVELKP